MIFTDLTSKQIVSRHLGLVGKDPYLYKADYQFFFFKKREREMICVGYFCVRSQNFFSILLSKTISKKKKEALKYLSYIKHCCKHVTYAQISTCMNFAIILREKFHFTDEENKVRGDLVVFLRSDI